MLPWARGAAAACATGLVAAQKGREGRNGGRSAARFGRGWLPEEEISSASTNAELHSEASALALGYGSSLGIKYPSAFP